MKKALITFAYLLLLSPVLYSQVLIDDVMINDASQNSKGVGRTSVAVAANGNVAVAWQDFNDYNIPIVEQPRVAVRMFTQNLEGIGPLNLFAGESRTLSIWTDDFLEPNPDIAFTPDGTLLVALEHEGRLSFPGVDLIGSSEAGIGVVSPNGTILDFNNTEGVVRWLIPLALNWAENPRISVSPTGGFLVALNGKSKETGRQGVLLQQFDADGSRIGDYFTPHTEDPGPQVNHQFPDVATNGDVTVVVWQDGRQDDNWDISAQFYTSNGPIGGPIKVNQEDPNGIFNILPSVVINDNGTSVVVWVDTRDSQSGDIYGQIFNASAAPIGGNFKISASQGQIWDRPEVAIRNDGGFLAVWTDSVANVSGLDALRARGRQYNSAGNPTTAPFVVPNQDVASGLINVASDGINYYLSWLDARENQTANVFFKVIGSFFTSVDELEVQAPTEFSLAQNYPNPFNPVTTIQFTVPKSSDVAISVYDVLGRQVTTLIDQRYKPGVYKINFDAGHLPSGIYFYRIQAADFVSSRKLMLLK